MYNPLLNTFVAVADCGSFTKASEVLFISSTAVMKQMNALEKHLELKLIERTPSGIHLTQAGAVIYKEAKFMMEYSQKAISKAKAALYDYETTFCVGTSLLNPAKPFMDLWYLVNQDFPSYKLHLVPLQIIMMGFFLKLRSLEKSLTSSLVSAILKNGFADVIFFPLEGIKKWLLFPGSILSHHEAASI